MLKQQDGTSSTLSDISKLAFSAPVTTGTGAANVVIAADGTIAVKGLANNSETKFEVTYDLGNGQKITIGAMNVKVASDALGAYGFMVFPTSDYYLVATKDGYDKYISRTISVEQEIVKWDLKMTEVNLSKGVNRISGLNRIDTAIALAKATYTGKVSKVILATADNYPDALAGSVLAYKLNAPILLVGSSETDQEKVLAYMKENIDQTGTVYILGGTGVISQAVQGRITASGFTNISRLGGADRYETAAKIAEKLEVVPGSPVILVSGENYPDALSISSVAGINQYPILLVRGTEIPDSIKKEISLIKPSKIYVIGLQGAVNKTIEQQPMEIVGK